MLASWLQACQCRSVCLFITSVHIEIPQQQLDCLYFGTDINGSHPAPPAGQRFSYPVKYRSTCGFDLHKISGGWIQMTLLISTVQHPAMFPSEWNVATLVLKFHVAPSSGQSSMHIPWFIILNECTVTWTWKPTAYTSMLAINQMRKAEECCSSVRRPLNTTGWNL